VHGLGDAERAALSQWLGEHGEDAAEYAVKTASQHDVTIFAELHEIQDNLLFLSRIIPDLYHRAGVRCIAMEVCCPQDNELLQRLVTADSFDRDLALKIARGGPWGVWGFTEYWDVLESVWRLNRGLAAGERKMRVVGLGLRCDGPSIGLLGVRDPERPTASPVWEKLRFVRVIDDLLLIATCLEEHYARSVDKEILEKGERGIVWVGAFHSSLYSKQAIVSEGKVIREVPRMGFLLRQKYGERVSQIMLHNPMLPSSAIAKVIDQSVKDAGKEQMGFQVHRSPFSVLRDDQALPLFTPGVSLGDWARGYIVLKPLGELKRCQWLDGYISDEMFWADKPYYEALTGRMLKDSQQANTAFSASGAGGG